jgi:hypothetical protein
MNCKTMIKQTDRVSLLLLFLAAWSNPANSFITRCTFVSFQKTTQVRHHSITTTIWAAQKEGEWKDEDHMIHSAADIHEDTPDELREEEELAAWDAHDCSDAGMEAAAEECTLMMDQEIAHKMHKEALYKKKKNPVAATASDANKKKDWNEEHLIHGAAKIQHEDTTHELREEEDLVARDAHSCNDTGMEAAAEERAVMLAQEMAHKLHEDALKQKMPQEKKDAL